MAEGNEKKVARGNRLVIQAQTWNAVIDAMKTHKSQRFRSGPRNPITDEIIAATTVLVENTVSDFSEAYHVLEIGTPLLEAEDDPVNLAERVGFQGFLPTRYGNIAIMSGPCSVGDIGTAVIAGITPVYVKMLAADHKWAKPVAGIHTHLESSLIPGPARILWHGAGGDPPSECELALVNLTGSGSGSDSDDEFSRVAPPCCPVWYTAYHHLGSLAVTVGDKLEAGAIVGTVGMPDSGAHSHFSLGDGSDFLNTTNYAVVGQTLDISDWLPWPTEGTRAPGVDPALYQPPVFAGTTDQAAARAYIRSVFAPWLPVAGYKQVYGSIEHKGGDFYAVDVFPEGVNPLDEPPDMSMSGTTIRLAIASNRVSSTVIFAGEISPSVKNMVIVRHSPCCCDDVWKKRTVRCATTTSGDLDTDYVVGSVVDDVTLALGDSILIKNQSGGGENRIGTVNTEGPPTFRADADTGSKLAGAVVRVLEGTVNSNTIWTCLDPAPIYIGTTATTWQVVWQTGFFARLTAVSGGRWKWRRLTATAGVWTDDGAESPTYSATPITYDGTNDFATPVVGMRVWMHWGKTEWEFFPLSPTALSAGCGLEIVDDEISLNLTDVAQDGLYWDGELCVIGVDYGCGLELSGTQLRVKVDDLTGDRAATGLVPVAAGLSPPTCPGVAIDTEVDFTTDETLVTNSVLSIVAGKLRQTLTKVTYTNHFNEAGILIDRTAGSPAASYTDLSLCAAVTCCTAEELACVCSKSGSGGPAPYSVAFTATPSGGVAPYTYEWTFGDGEFSTDQNPTHEYVAAGTYNPHVDVTDACGNTVTCTVSGSIVVTGLSGACPVGCDAGFQVESVTMTETAPGSGIWTGVFLGTDYGCFENGCTVTMYHPDAAGNPQVGTWCVTTSVGGGWTWGDTTAALVAALAVAPHEVTFGDYEGCSPTDLLVTCTGCP